MNARGDDIEYVWVNGFQIPAIQSTKKAQVQIYKGQNVIASHVVNTAWGSGFVAGMLLPGGDTLKTDSTWKVCYKDPTSDPTWSSLTYDDSKWENAPQGGLASTWPGYQNWGPSAVNFYYWKLPMILGGFKVLYRKEITWPTGASMIRIRGNNFNYTLYINGNKVSGAGNEFANCGSNMCNFQNNTTNISYSGSGKVCIALEANDATRSGNGILVKMAIPTGTDPSKWVYLDTTWKCWTQEQPNWNQLGFDDSSWFNPGFLNSSTYDSYPLGIANWICPTNFWYRKVFNSKDGAGVTMQMHSLLNNSKIARVEYYNLQGRLLSLPEIMQIKTTSSLIVKRIIYKNGVVKSMKVMSCN